MKVIKDTPLGTTGKRRMIIEVDANAVILPVRPDGFYKLGQPSEEVIAGHVIAAAAPVHWCSMAQEWV